jgi:acyl carrier protein
MSNDIETKVLDLLRAACVEQGVAEAVSLDSSLGDLGIDSIKLVALIFELEKALGFEADEGQLATLASVRDVVEMVETAVLSSVSEA